METILENIVRNNTLWPLQHYATLEYHAEGLSKMYTAPLIRPEVHPGGMGGMFHPPEIQTSLYDYGFEKPKALWKDPEVEILQYMRGMNLEGDVKLYGNRNTAILHQDLGEDLSFDIHHHNLGRGAIEFNPTSIGNKFRSNL